MTSTVTSTRFPIRMTSETRAQIVDLDSPGAALPVWSGPEDEALAMQRALTEGHDILAAVDDYPGRTGASDLLRLRALVIAATRPLPYAGEQTCTYGGDCPEPAAFEVTRTDSLHQEPRTYACADHVHGMTDSCGRYVGGWGDVTCTVRRLPVATAPTD